MRRWNGWGDDSQSYPLPSSAVTYLERVVGKSIPPHDAALFDVVASVPESRLPEHRLVDTRPETRLRHARGQSLPDWIALRSGRIAAFPDGVARPASGDKVRELLGWAEEIGARVIPYGGGTSVVGHINPLPGDRPVLTLSLEKLNRLAGLDERSQLATFGAGVTGPELERRLGDRGFTLGHFPQSFELSTLGGWIASRSSGQQSLRYGRIDHLFAGGRLESPAGTLELRPFPGSAAGPDLRQLVLGSEGRLGVLTEATVRITRRPQKEAFHAVFFRGWDEGLEATRRLAQSGLPLSMLRLSTPEETETTLALAGHKALLGPFEKVLAALGAKSKKCMLIAGFSGSAELVAAARGAALAIAREGRGIHVGKTFGRQWHKNRFRTPYLRNSLWERGFAVDTLETAATWAQVPELAAAIGAALRDGLRETGERVHVFSHLSHVYPSGSSIYTTYLFRLASDPEENLRRWRTLKDAASRAIVEGGGTISHQHGVGVDHLPYLAAEKGALGMSALEALFGQLDPKGVMNPGKLVA
ncbi:MAG: FAD-binding oxidoreductase [Myxococcales bacterium]|jgi:alkyldihydroxyacetonephosphate synthase